MVDSKATIKTATLYALGGIAVCGFVAVLIYAYFVFDTLSWYRPASPQKFVRQAWVENSKIGSSRARNAMADDLLNSKVLIGLSRRQITELLGEPEGHFSLRADMIYWLGPTPGDHEWLCINFDTAGLVSNAWVAAR